MSSERIRQLNDSVRHTFSGARILVSNGVAALGDDALGEILALVHTYDHFTPANDPFGEHDFGLISWDGHDLAWKIDYFDMDLAMHSPDPADPTVTARVLTIMLAEEM
ncbi:DUF3768 domain-containing protein [Saliniramus fredricksonii]|uniref:DUF3768 domain-containing protein n=1 Tax=Saliniramus fredricksonii TaxID=1653334 RepID=A0ABY0K512_9HYPH|nr:DUF3768 domain-containing protein [Saliniramus fredricksonii]SCC78515.1 Protein of unknown function [Saliniramus fredricksonii]